MIILSNRLKAIADEIDNNETMADIGTDHGFLPLYLWENKVSPHVIMIDISPGSLDKAKENCSRAYPQVSFDYRLGNGLQVLDKHEASNIVIAGMGGILISEILEEDPEKAQIVERFILQPRNRVGLLRKWLDANKYEILKEKLVREGRFICEILTVSYNKNYKPKKNANIISFEYPKELIKWKNPLTEEYLKRHLDMEERILLKMMQGKNMDEGIKEQKLRIMRIQELIKMI